MRIQAFEVTEHRIPFRFSFKHALAERSEGHGILVRAIDVSGRDGFGECVPRSYVTGETPASVKVALFDHLLRPFLDVPFPDPDAVVVALTEKLATLPRDRHAAFCALELAVLDLAGRVFDRSAGEIVLGPIRHTDVAYSGVVSADGAASALEACEKIKALGVEHVKLKVGLDADQDHAILEGARQTLGPACRLRIDANCAWTAEEALDRLRAFRTYDLESVEQPLRGDDVEGLAWLTARSPTPVMVDESLASLEDAEKLVARRACHNFNIRISKCGGLINAVRIRDLGRAHGVGCQLGAQVGETALLSAAGRHFATRSDDVLFFEGSYGTILLEKDIGISDLTIGPGGRAPALDGPGLGVGVDRELLEEFVVDRVQLEGR